jgi:hypothetical protein
VDRRRGIRLRTIRAAAIVAFVTFVVGCATPPSGSGRSGGPTGSVSTGKLPGPSIPGGQGAGGGTGTSGAGAEGTGDGAGRPESTGGAPSDEPPSSGEPLPDERAAGAPEGDAPKGSQRSSGSDSAEGESDPEATADDSSGKGGEGERSAQAGRSGSNAGSAGAGERASGDVPGGPASGTARNGAGGESGAPEDNPFGDGTRGQGGDEAFDRSLGDFDSVITREQDAIAHAGGVAADESLSRADQPDSASEQSTGSGVGGVPDDAVTGERDGRPSSPVEAVADEPITPIEGCADGDKVARQLCEAARLEADPFLRSALWDEYNERKRIAAAN